MTVNEMVKDLKDKEMNKYQIQMRIGKIVCKKFAEGKSCKEIGEELGIPESAVRSVKRSYEELQASKNK